MTNSEFQKCIHEKHSCRVATPIRPETAGACGISNYFEHEEDGCTYITTGTKQDFFHTSGNFTCFSVKKRTIRFTRENSGIQMERNPAAIKIDARQDAKSRSSFYTLHAIAGIECVKDCSQEQASTK